MYGVPDADEIVRLENGEAKYATNTKLPYGYSCYLSDIHRFTRVADLLGVSLDYLLCRSDEPQSVSSLDTEPAALVWHEPDVKPPEGAHIVFIDENGVADEDVYVSGRLKSGWADWEEVVLWTLHPDDPAQPETTSEKQLTTLCGVDLAAPEWQAGNPPKAGEYYACFDIGKNACRLATWSGWDWRFAGGATIEAPCLGWWPLPARASAKEGA